MCAISDIIDGIVARKTNSISIFGSHLDTIADFIFLLIVSIKILPIIRLPYWVLIWICIIAVLKILNTILSYLRNKRYLSEHTILNKMTGGLLFLLPLVILITEINYYSIIICIVSSIASLQEGYYIYNGIEIQ